MRAEFEVGKFYKVQTFGGGYLDHRKINCLCVRRSKSKVWFQHVNRNADGEFFKREFYRWLKAYIPQDKSEYEEVEDAYDPDMWESVAPTKATEVGVKPRIWDDVKEIL